MDFSELVKDFLKLLGALVLWPFFGGKRSLLDLLENHRACGWLGLLLVSIAFGLMIASQKP